MTDNYPTRKTNESKFIKRKEKIIYTDTKNDFYEQNGFLVLKNFFEKSEIKNILKESHSGLVTNEPGSNLIRSKTGVHKTKSISDLSTNKKLITKVKEILGNEIYLYQSRINYKEAISGTGWHWHSDFETWHSQDGMPNMRCLTAMIPLTVNNIYNGSLMVIPRSHTLFCSCIKEENYTALENFANQKEGIPNKQAIEHYFYLSNNKIKMILCKPMDLILFDCNLIHVSASNLSPKNRTNLFFVYNHIENKPVDPFSYNERRPNEMCEIENIKIIK